MIKKTPEQKNKIFNAIKSGNIYGNEAVWNFFICHIISNSPLQNEYLKLFCDSSLPISLRYDVWFESEPLSPRTKRRGCSEGNTKLDIAFGSIRSRSKTLCGIEFNPNNKDSWVCFVEGKFHSDSSNRIAHDSEKNQLTRVIENLLCFQSNNMFPSRLYFSLLTPKRFKKKNAEKNYSKKMQEYKNQKNILKDIESSSIQKRNKKNWKYPHDLEERIKLLSINWVAYEEIFCKEYGIDELDLTNLNEIQKKFFYDKLKGIKKFDF